MREIRQSGSVGGETPRRLPYLNQSLSADAASKRGCGGRDVRDPECESSTYLTSNIASWYLFFGCLGL